MNRPSLSFPQEVRRNFSYLEKIGFDCVNFEVTLVRYASAELAINIYHGRQSYEIGLTIESLHERATSYSFSALLRLVDAKRAEGYRNYSARSKESVIEGVRLMALQFYECVKSGILSDEQLFVKLKVQRDTVSSKYAVEVQLQQAHDRLRSAWAKKDFEEVVQILGPLQEHLNRSDLKKLEFSKRHL